MTREEAIDKLKGFDFIGSNEDIEFQYALEMAIKALEQEPILDKIKAEIEAECCITVGRENDPAITLYDVFEIIDKYRTESEDKGSLC